MVTSLNLQNLKVFSEESSLSEMTLLKTTDGVTRELKLAGNQLGAKAIVIYVSCYSYVNSIISCLALRQLDLLINKPFFSYDDVIIF